MKPVTKENLLEAIQKVEEQGKLTHYAYEDNTGCRCVVGHLMEEKELIKLKEDELNDASIGALLQQSDFISVPKKDSLILARLQSLNDIEDLPVDVFVKEARAFVEELFA